MASAVSPALSQSILSPSELERFQSSDDQPTGSPTRQAWPADSSTGAAVRERRAPTSSLGINSPPTIAPSQNHSQEPTPAANLPPHSFNGNGNGTGANAGSDAVLANSVGSNLSDSGRRPIPPALPTRDWGAQAGGIRAREVANGHQRARVMYTQPEPTAPPLDAHTGLPPGSVATAANPSIAQDSKEKKNKNSSSYRHLFAVHNQNRESCLTHGSSNPPSFGGFRNLMILMLVGSNFRLMIENFRKYGVLICIQCHDYSKPDLLYGLTLYLAVPCHLVVAYLVERFAAYRAEQARKEIMATLTAIKKKDDITEEEKQMRLKSLDWQRSFKITWYLVAWIHTINATLNLIIASSVVYYQIHHPLIGTLCEAHAIIVWLKSCSYAFTNRDLRHAYLSEAVKVAGLQDGNSEGGEQTGSAEVPEIYKKCEYPKNIRFRNLVYFWWAPTLVYQPVYPRTKHIRWTFVAKRVGEILGLSVAIWVAIAQYAAPLLRNSLATMQDLDVVSVCERVLKLSTISLFCWLAFFFAFFQSYLNILAEILRFGDRDFYADWWNAPSIRVYWTNWNRPVSRFMRRHIYNPLIARGVNPVFAQTLVFILSGVLHELLVGVPTHNLIGVAGFGMILQIPLVLVTDPLYTPYRKKRVPSSKSDATETSEKSTTTTTTTKATAAMAEATGGTSRRGGQSAPQPGATAALPSSPTPSEQDRDFVPQPVSRTAATIGNMVFWVSFCLVGQPLAMLLYFFAWEAKYGSSSRA